MLNEPVFASKQLNSITMRADFTLPVGAFAYS